MSATPQSNRNHLGTEDVDAPDIRPAKLAGYLSAIFVSAAFTAIIIQYSLRYGRLLIYPTFDDVIYFADALERLGHVYQGSPIVFFREWIRDPPHSPFSTVFALLGFLIFGVHDWAPYAANAVLAFAFILFTEKIMEDAPALCRGCAIVFVLSSPVAGAAVYWCKPDMACGLLTTMAIVALLGTRLSGGSQTRPVLGGIFFGLALLTKPAVFALTSVLLVLAMLCALARDARLEPAKFDRRAALRSMGVFVLTALAISAPYFLVGTKSIVQYIYIAELGRDVNIWRSTLPLGQQVFYYLSGYAGQLLLGRHLFLIPVIAALWTLHLWLAPTREKLLNTLAYSAVIFAGYFGVALNWLKSPLYGAAFQTSLIFFIILVLRDLVEVEKARGWKMPWARALMVATAIVGLMLFQWPKFYISAKDLAHAPEIRQIDDKIMAAIINSSGAVRSTVVVTTRGRVNVNLFNYLALKRRLPLTFIDRATSGNLEEHRAAWVIADFVIAGEQGNTETSLTEQAYAIQDQVLAALRARPDFVEIAAVPTLNGKSIFVFRNIGPVPRR